MGEVYQRRMIFLCTGSKERGTHTVHGVPRDWYGVTYCQDCYEDTSVCGCPGCQKGAECWDEKRRQGKGSV